MKGEIISCPHKDIYFLETNTKSESTDLANMFASPSSATGRGHMIKCKPRTKLKQKYNPALDFFVQNKATTKSAGGHAAKEDVGKCSSSGNQSEQMTTAGGSGSRRNSIDLYEEAATILGLTCSQTDDCKCIECQCHYFDFEDDLDFTPLTSSALGTTSGGSGEYYVDHNSSCAIQ
ncbi:uncharacterized protein [Atheta coriaria]|uniref:uncharacterized protein n=1 Tax=Dalotia coriaria TaxID=877792 RepID=UPI0031F46D76